MSSAAFQTVDTSVQSRNKQREQNHEPESRQIQLGNIRFQILHYPRGYHAASWCACGTAFCCLQGEITFELSNGQMLIVSEGMSHRLAENVVAYSTHAEKGATVLIAEEVVKSERKSYFNPWRM